MHVLLGPGGWYDPHGPGRRHAAVSSIRPMATMIVSPLLARVVGQASRRGLILRVPSGDALLESVEAWLLAEYGDSVRSMTPAGDRGRRRRTDGRAPPGRPAARDVRRRIGARRADRRDRDDGPGLPPLHRPPRRAARRGPVDHVGPRPGRPGGDPRRHGDDVRRPGRDRACLPRLARPDAGQGPCRPGRARHPAPDRHPGDDPLHVRRRDRHGPRAARRRLARSGRRRHAGRDRHHAVVGGHDRRPDPPQPGSRPDVARGPLAPAGDQGGTRAARRGPPDPHPGLPDRPDARLPVAGVGRTDRAARHRRPDVPPGRRPCRARRRRGRADRLPPRAGRPSATRAGRSRSPGRTPSAGRPRSGGAAALGRSITLAAVQTATDGGAMGAQAFVDQSAATSAPMPSTIGPAA